VTPAQVVARVFEQYRNAPRSRSFRYSFSGAGETCLRSLVYDAHDADDGKPPAVSKGEVSWSLSAACGTAVGDALEAAGLLLGYRSQVRALFDTGAIKVMGNGDTTTDDIQIDWKVVGENKWERIQKQPDDKHRLQVNGYAVALDRPRWALVYLRGITIYDGSKTPEVKIHAGEASVELAQDLCGVWESVETHRKLRTLPERVFEAAPDKFPCGWCRHQSRCLTQSPEEGTP